VLFIEFMLAVRAQTIRCRELRRSMVVGPHQQRRMTIVVQVVVAVRQISDLVRLLHHVSLLQAVAVARQAGCLQMVAQVAG
jgi:hypothetical protein